MSNDYIWIRFLFQRGIGFIYFLGFVNILQQFIPLCGSQGILPARKFIQTKTFLSHPSLFFLRNDDPFLKMMGFFGLALSILAVTGFSELYSPWTSVLIWFCLWASYLSFVNVGQIFYAYGWEYLLLELGFLTIFSGALHATPSLWFPWLLRWTLFRLMFGAGLIKIKNDRCWRSLSCLKFHYQSQPTPNPLSRWFQFLPDIFHRLSAGLNHFAELLVPFAFFGPAPVRMVAGLFTIAFQAFLLLSGNFSWINLLSMILCLGCLDDGALKYCLNQLNIDGGRLDIVTQPSFLSMPVAVVLVVLILSVRPTFNLFKKRQLMNASFEPLHISNAYGAFGIVLRERFELVIEGTGDAFPTAATIWSPYEFIAKPTDPGHPPRQISPYFFRLDWELAMAAASPEPTRPWMLSLVHRLLSPGAIKIPHRSNPFAAVPPRYIRIQKYRYFFSKPGTDVVWQRELVGNYLPQVSLNDPVLETIVKFQGWNKEALLGNNAVGERAIGYGQSN